MAKDDLTINSAKSFYYVNRRGRNATVVEVSVVYCSIVICICWVILIYREYL